jgi:hypothetical protein
VLREELSSPLPFERVDGNGVARARHPGHEDSRASANEPPRDAMVGWVFLFPARVRRSDETLAVWGDDVDVDPVVLFVLFVDAVRDRGFTFALVPVPMQRHGRSLAETGP